VSKQFRKFLQSLTEWPSWLVAASVWLVIFSAVLALFLTALLHPSTSERFSLSARSLNEKAGLRFPLGEEDSGIVGRLQAMNVAPINDDGLALQWHLFSWPNQWFERFPLTVDQNMGGLRGQQLEEHAYWYSRRADGPRPSSQQSLCPQSNPATPSSFKLWDSAMTTPGDHLGELLLSDSMVSSQHNDLSDVVALAQGQTGLPLEGDVHGTHVAGIISAKRNGEGVVGVVPGLSLRLFPLKVTQKRSGPRIEGSDVLQNLDAIIASMIASSGTQKSPRVILLSWAFFEQDGLTSEFIESLESRIRQLLEFDVVVVVPAGNHEAGRSDSGGRVLPASWSGQFRDLRGSLLPVASLDVCARPSWFTNLAANDLGDVLMAPGERIFSTLPENDYGFMSGTSAAAAQVAAVLAMTAAQFPDVEMKTQVHTLIRSASPLASQVNDRLASFDAPAFVQGLMAEFGWIARY
jgi:subtilisin family serine protease